MSMTMDQQGPRGAIPRRMLGALLLVAACAGLTGCGDDDPGNVYVDNLTDTTVPEFALTFIVGAVGEPFTGNLLFAPLPPGNAQFVGTFHEDYYDAEAEMEFGDVVRWRAIYVGCGEDVYFEIY